MTAVGSQDTASALPSAAAIGNSGHGWSYWAQHLEDTLRFFGHVLKKTPSTS